MAGALVVLLWISAGLWALFFIQTLLNWLLVPELSRQKSPSPTQWPFVSIVVPARNEESAIRKAVSSFCNQDYEGFEVIVVDDQSTDQTPDILRNLRSEHVNLTVIAGTEPPEGWLGKTNALEVGRTAAKGNWILFVDADVVYAPDLLRRAIAYVLEQDAAMLVLWPRYMTEGVLEAIMMSSLYLVVFAAFPLFMVARSRSRWFAAGSGVFNLVRRDALQDCAAFESLRNSVFDDFALGHRVKGTGHAVAVAPAITLVQIRMYHGIRELFHGCTKNVYHLAGRRSPWLMPLGFLLAMILSLLPYIGLVAGLIGGSVSAAAIAALALMHLVMACTVIRFHQPWYVACSNPVRELFWWGIVLWSCISYHRSGIIWRGRQYPK